MTLEDWGVYWRSTLVAELRKADGSAFAGATTWKLAYQGPTEVVEPDSLAFQNGVLALLDIPRDVVVLAAFPMWYGPTRVTHTRSDHMELVTQAQQSAMDNGVQFLILAGPSGGLEAVYIRELSMSDEQFLREGPAPRLPGGPAALTDEGVATIGDFSNAVARAADVFVAEESDLRFKRLPSSAGAPLIARICAHIAHAWESIRGQLLEDEAAPRQSRGRSHPLRPSR